VFFEEGLVMSHVPTQPAWAPLVMAGVALLTLSGCNTRQLHAGRVQDEALRANRMAASFPPADEDYFHDMDSAMALERPEIMGRNMWIVWTGGNDRFWDQISQTSFSTLDFLKTLSSHPSMNYGRESRWRYLGLVNEPCYTKPTGPDPNRFGLWLDQRDPSCAPDPFADAKKYPGVAIGARGKNMPVGSYYGEPSGIVGLRLFPNPDFDEAAKRKWDAERYYRDPSYYESRDLIKPYRVGMSCAFCHVGPNPVKPPPDPENPKWEHLSSNVGAQYYWVDRIFNWRGDANKSSFFYQLFHTSRPGSLDTSLVSSDGINNPRTMNAVYGLGPRMAQAKAFGKETIGGGELDNKQFNNYVPAGSPLAGFFQPPNTVFTPRVLKDGSDSVGALGALNRVYLNIGLFSEEWTLHFRPLVGGVPITPIPIATAQKNSSYWNATEAQTIYMAQFFLKSTGAHLLKDAPGGAQYLTADAATLRRGKEVFGEYCARCHSSKLPPLPADLDMANCNNKDYKQCWDRYWALTKTDGFKRSMRDIVLSDSFTTDNYLSTEFRVPSTLLQTNACSPVATNAIAGNIWDNFSSQTYKSLQSVGSIKVRNPITGAERDFVLPGGGRGYTRPASLISAWSTAPFLQNNSLGRFEWSPSVDARMRSFNDSIEKLLWPEKREKDRIFANETGPGVGVIDRSTAPSSIWIPTGYIPDPLRPLLGLGRRLFPFLFREGELTIGPIPQGFPVSLLANADLMGSTLPTDAERRQRRKDLISLLRVLKRDLKDGKDIFANPKLLEGLVEMSNCPDYVVNKGHYFGTNLLLGATGQPEETPLSDPDKRALIAFVQTF
jgi:hypothetical protein